MVRRSTSICVSVLVLAAAARAQSLTPLVSEGDTVIGVGAITAFNPAFIGMTDDRMWTMVADTDFSTVTEDIVHPVRPPHLGGHVVFRVAATAGKPKPKTHHRRQVRDDYH